MSGNVPDRTLSPQQLERRLAAILSADVQGYSRLMGDNEEQTVQTLTAYRKVLTVLVTQYRGRVVDMPGDNMLAEFASVIDAVQAAVHIQGAMQERNAELPPHRRMEFRIGVHLGDILSEGGRIYGEGVNIAARLESLSPAGGVCISGVVYDQVAQKLSLPCQFLGEQFLKNIARPVRAYQIVPPSSASPEPHSAQTLGPEQNDSSLRDSTSNSQPRTPFLVGRAAELEYLEQCLAAALAGQRQIVFVTGDPGIGKTTLLDAFLERLRGKNDVRVTYGQCVEQYGVREAYLPLLEATTRLCRAPGGERRVEALRRYAPSWLAHLPSLVDPSQLAQLQQYAQGANRERMLREMAEAAELFTGRRGLVVILEDLHWSDAATLEWLAYMARRREEAKLLIIGTYRPTDMLTSDLPLKGVMQELLSRGQCEELRLAPLGERAVEAYLIARLKGASTPPAWVEALHRRTGGNPLFLVNMVEYFIQHGAVVEKGGQWRLQEDGLKLVGDVPDTLRRLIERQFERLTEEEQQLLEVASVEGREFVSTAVAAGLQADIATVEERCERLARKGQFIIGKGIENWPDGAIGGRYSFLHALYQNVLYARIAEARRVRLHRVLGTRKEQAYGEQAKEIAGELAAHFAVGRDLQRAVTYSKQAAETAVRRHAHQEAVAYINKGLELLHTLPDTAERVPQELELQVMLATSLVALKGYASPEVEQAYAQARALCRRVDATSLLFPVLRGLVSFYQVRAQLQTARELGDQLLHLSQQEEDPILRVQAHYGQGVTLFDQAEFETSAAHLTRVLALYTPQQHNRHVAVYGGYDPGVACLQWLARILWLRGYPTQAQQRSEEAIQLARELGHPLSLAWAWNIAAVIHQYRGEEQETQTCVQEAVSIVHEHELAFMAALATILQGWALMGQGQRVAGVEKIREGVVAYQSTGAALSLPGYLSLLAGAYARDGQMAEAQRLVEEAISIIHKTGEQWLEAELYRIKGELTLQQNGEQRTENGEQKKDADPRPLIPDPQAEAEGYFLKALDIARRQQTKSWELRAAMSLARLWRKQGKIPDARRLLEETYGWFTEGFETKDLRDAAALLTKLGGHIQQAEGREGNSVVNIQYSVDSREKVEEVGQWTAEKEERAKVDGQKEKNVQRAQSPPDPRFPIPHTSHPTPNTQCVFRREGEYWSVTFASATCRLRDNRGMRYLAQLLQHPDEEIHSLRIVADDTAYRETPPLGSSSRGTLDDLVKADEKPLTEFSDAGEILDPQARAAYRRRLTELQVELTEARESNDLNRTEALQTEMDFLTRELSQAVGLGGRVRKTGSLAERARINATKALKTAIRQVSQAHPVLGQHLQRTIRTGTYCSYVPGPHSPGPWQA